MMKKTSVSLFTLALIVVLVSACNDANGLKTGAHTGGQTVGSDTGGRAGNGGMSAGGATGAGGEPGGSGGNIVCPPCLPPDCPYGQLPVVGCGCAQCAPPPGDANAGTASTCTVSPSNVDIEFRSTCASFVPPLGGSEIVFVERTVSGPVSDPKIAHRFRSTASCGFDVVLTLPNLQLAVDSQPYQLSQWWESGSGPTRLVAAVLRRALPGPILLGAAAVEKVDLLNMLISPLKVTLNGPTCTAARHAGENSQVLENSSVPLTCSDDSAGPSLRLCQSSTSAYRMVAYQGSADSTQLPALFGDSTFLVPMN
jgi:predicted small secreted protein